MSDEPTPLIRSIVERITAVQIAVAIVSVAAIAAITWFMLNGEKVLSNKDMLSGLLIFSAVIVGLSIVLIALFYLVFSTATNGNSLVGQITEKVMSIPPMQMVATVIGFVTVGLISWFIVAGGDVFSTAEKARGLITFAVAIVTVAIALIMVLYVIFGVASEQEFSNRFTFGKDVLMVFVGILGTIMGFYYGSGKVTPGEVASIQKSGQEANLTPANVFESQGFELLIKQDYDGAQKAFDLAAKSTPPSPNIKNISAISKLLTERRPAFDNAADSAAKQVIWQQIYCEISNNQWAAGQAKETIDKFTAGCKPPTGPGSTASGANG
jgi:hypothetical protein